jgi:hypothetical protein
MAVLTGTVGFTATNASGIQLTEAEKDGYWLFIFPYQDAKALVKKSSETINIKNEGKSYKYVFTNHILSCGTNMNGFIIETLENGKLIVKGLFTVSNNPYKIERLEVNLSKNLQHKLKTCLVIWARMLI